MSFKAMILLTRRPDMTHEQYEQWWLATHVPLAKQLPGLRGATFNVVQNPSAGEPDGITELWFDTREAFDDCLCERDWQASGGRFNGQCC